MIKLGVNTVLFKTVSFAEAARLIKTCGYDGLEISAIQGMCEHLNLDNWQAQQGELRAIMEANDLKFLSTEVASHDFTRLQKAFEAAAALGIPVVNVGPGGPADDEEAFKRTVDTLQKLAEMAEPYGVTLCAKAHVGGAIYNTPTTLRAMREITAPAFGVDMDPSHIYRGGDQPEEAIKYVISRMKHIHIRDCTGRQSSPGHPFKQMCGSGEIDLFGYFKAAVEAKYDGPVCLEVIGPDLRIEEATLVAAESYGYMNACLKILGAR